MALKVWPPKLSQVWTLVCNLGIVALTICVLASCRTSTESNYSLMNADRDFLQKMLGEPCYNASEPFIPDSYRIGLSGACRIENEATITCEKTLLKVNWVTLFEADVTATNTTGNQAAILDQCIDGLHEKGVDHAFTGRLAAALFALLIISIFLNVGALAVAAWTGSGFAKPVFIIELLDEMILVTCIGIFIGIINHEVGRYIPDTLRLRDVDDKQILGVGFWMLVGMFATRAVSHPLLFITTLVVALIVLVVPILLLLACCCGGDRREEAVVNIRHRIYHIYGTDEWEK